ncbi:MAG TPA: ABC transporter permease [Chloroflexota bacterium]|jgi:peptide/nickel transport system permease protein|nr:ABC transporter permease [Chloroflexota bacterium]
MLAFIIRRIAIAIPLLWGVLTLTFFSFRLLVPGDPVAIMLFGHATHADYVRLRHELGYDKPLLFQYWNFLKGAVHFDFGNSVQSQLPVAHEIASRFPVTLELAASALFLATVFGVICGIICALCNRNIVGPGLTTLAVLGFSIPEFVLGVMAGLVFGVYLHWLPVSGWGDLEHVILPASCLALGLASGLTRLIRATILDALNQDFVRTAKAKGVRGFMIVTKHVLRNALLPVITVYGLSVAGLLSGAVIIENVFALPGLGTLALSAVAQRNFPVVEGTTFFFALILISANLVVDVLYGFIDPRIHYS